MLPRNFRHVLTKVAIKRLSRIRVMEPISISAKTEMLRNKIKRILLEERLYRRASQRSRGSAHTARELRLIEIREELVELARLQSEGGKD